MERRKFTVDFKLQVIQYAEENSGNAASRHFNLDSKQVREWKKQKSKLEALQSKGKGDIIRQGRRSIMKIFEKNKRAKKTSDTDENDHPALAMFKIDDVYKSGEERCANCTMPLSIDKVTSLKKLDPYMEVHDDVRITVALALIFDIEWDIFFKKIREEHHDFSNDNLEIMLCKDCALFLDDVYSAYCRFTNSTHSNSLIKLAQSCKRGITKSGITKEKIIPSEVSSDENSSQINEDDSLFDDFHYEEDDPLPDQDVKQDVKCEILIKEVEEAEEGEDSIPNKSKTKTETNDADFIPSGSAESAELPQRRQTLSRSSKMKTESFRDAESDEEEDEYDKSDADKAKKREKTKYECSACGKTYFSKQKLAFHAKKHLEPAKKRERVPTFGEFPCKQCGKIFKTAKYARSHERLMHSATSVKCQVCQKVMKNRALLHYHMRVNHTSPEKFAKIHTTCEICGKKMHATSLKQHMLGKHSEEKQSFNCDKCDKVFNSEEKLKHHIEAHYSTAVFNCSQCNKKCLTEYYLNEHIEKYHNAEKPFACEICPLRFQKHNLLVKHQAVHSADKQYVCEECGKGYASRPGLKQHLKCHREEELGTNDFKCPDCMKTFKNSYCLAAHKIRAHRSDLVAGKRLFTCTICGKTLYDDRNLKKHMAAVHKDGDVKFQRELPPPPPPNISPLPPPFVPPPINMFMPSYLN